MNLGWSRTAALALATAVMVLLAAGGALARAPKALRVEPFQPALRGSAPLHKPAAPFVAPVRPPDPALMSPGLSGAVAPRLKARGAAGGSQCRTACAADHFACLAQDGGDCPVIWGRCVAACPESSAADL